MISAARRGHQRSRSRRDDEDRALDALQTLVEWLFAHPAHRARGVDVSGWVADRRDPRGGDGLSVDRGIGELEARVLEELPLDRCAVIRARTARCVVEARAAARPTTDEVATATTPSTRSRRSEPTHNAMTPPSEKPTSVAGPNHSSNRDQVLSELVDRAVAVTERRRAVSAEVVGKGSVVGQLRPAATPRSNGPVRGRG